MGKRILVGVDGGGTKTKVRIEDQDGKVIGSARGGPAQIRYSISEAWNSVLSTIDNALAGTNISYDNPEYDFHVVMGLAGCEVTGAREKFLAGPHPFATTGLYNDAHIACLGAHAAEDGGVLIMGTGVHGRASVEGKVYRVAGWGFPHDDQGGGAWLGLTAVQHAFAAYDGREERSPLADQILAQFESKDELVAWATSSDARGFAMLAPIVMACARHQDNKARMIVKQAAGLLEKVMVTLIKKSGCPDLKIACIGGMAQPMREFLSQDVLSHIVEAKGDAESGAILLARQEMNKYLDSKSSV